MAREGSTKKETSSSTSVSRYTFNAFTCVRPLSLMVAVQLGIPDAVRRHDGGPISVSDLASAVGIAEASKVHALRRLMRALSCVGCFERSVAGEEEEEAYALNLFSRQLVKNGPSTSAVAPFFLHAMCLPVVQPWYSMAAWFRGERPESGATAFEAAHGETFREYSLGCRAAEYRDARACDARWAMAVVTREHPEVFRGLTSLVDVGGEDGTAAKAIKDAFPDMIRCTVLELPHVVAASPAVEGVDFVEGDMFEHVPEADAVLLKWVLHQWDDEDGVRILRRCREAVDGARECGGKVIIVEMVMRDGGSGSGSGGGGDWEEVEAQHLSDLHMLANTGGKERTEREWRRLLAAAGFSCCKITPAALGPRSVIEAYP